MLSLFVILENGLRSLVLHKCHSIIKGGSAGEVVSSSPALFGFNGSLQCSSTLLDGRHVDEMKHGMCSDTTLILLESIVMTFALFCQLAHSLSSGSDLAR